MFESKSETPAPGRTWIVIACIAAAALASSPDAVSSGTGPGCEDAPRAIEGELGATFNVGPAALSLRAERTAVGVGEAGISVDLLARHRHPRTGTARTGSMVRGLDVEARAVDTLTGRVVATSALAPRLSSFGPSYGGELRLDRDTADRISVRVRIAAGVEMPPAHGGGAPELLDACAGLPLTIGFDPAAAPVSSASEPGVDAPEDDFNTTLLSTIDPRAPDDYNDVWGYSDGTTHLAILGGENGTSFIDVTDPTNPVEVGYVSGPNSAWRDMKTYGTYAYIVTEGSGTGTGMQIVDLSDPSNPVLVNTYTDTFTTAHNIWIDVDTGLAWVVGTSNGTRILDLTGDPANPVEIASWTDRYVHDAYVADGFAYFSEINDGIHEILDANDPTNLVVLSTWETPTGDAHNSWANDAQTLCATTDETTGGNVAVYDVTVKERPQPNTTPLLSEYAPDESAVVHNVHFDDDFDNETIAISHYSLGWKYVDLHRPTAPVEWASYDTYANGDTGFNGSWGAYPFDPRGYHYVADIQTGLYVVEYTPSGGTLSGVVRDAANAAPIPRAEVVLLSDSSVSVTASDGVYAVYAPGGATRLRVSAWGYSSRIVDAGEMPVGGRLDFDVDLEPLDTAGVSGTVTSAAGGAVEGARVSIAGSPLSVETDAAGAYAFPDVAAGSQVIVVEAFGFSSGERRTTVVPEQPVTVDFELSPAILADDAESDRGWTFGAGGDTATSGQWTRVDPNGTGGGTVQPEDDATPDPGVTAFITGQSPPGASTEDNDVEGGVTTLTSPPFDASAAGAARLSYRRWVSTASGFFSGGRLLVQASNDGGVNWVSLESQSSNAAAWVEAAFDLGSVIALSDDMRVRFRAEATTGFDSFRVLEAGIDDFDVVSACRTRFNAESVDSDADGAVDACDACPFDSGDDADGDGVCGDADNAPTVSNADQVDTDGDGVGDVADNCPNVPNVAQRDLDRDGLGDPCDDDMDGDGTPDATDADRDDDGVEDAGDICPEVPDPAQLDSDSDGVGDRCDLDDGRINDLTLDGDRLSWTVESGSDGYNVYRGDLGDEGLFPLAGCRVAELNTAFWTDFDGPRPGDGYFYVVARVAGGVEGSLGADSSGTERSVQSPCP